MASIQLALAAPTAHRRAAYRLLTPVAALLLLAALAGLWRWGPHPLYFDILKRFGFAPFRFPFLDIHAILAAAQCQRLGIDVYLSNPCDALGRVHVYSPLWLALVPSFLGTAQTTPVGLGLDVLFILSLWVVIRPERSGEALLMAAAALSPMTVYALERANCDLAIFLLIVAGCALDRAPRPWRLGCYALFLLAGLLKYYPLVLLVLLARERRRDALIGTVLAMLIAGGLAGLGLTDLARALANIPALSYFADSFSALNLPFGFAQAVLGRQLWRAGGLLLLGILAALAIARTRRTARLLAAADLDRNGWAGANPAGRGAAADRVLLRRTEYRLSRDLFCAGNAGPGAALPAGGRRSRAVSALRPDHRRTLVPRLGRTAAPPGSRARRPPPRRPAKRAPRAIVLDRPRAGVVVAGHRPRRDLAQLSVANPVLPVANPVLRLRSGRVPPATAGPWPNRIGAPALN